MHKEVLQVVTDFSLSMSIWTQYCSDLVTAPFWLVLEVMFFQFYLWFGKVMAWNWVMIFLRKEN